MTPREIAEGLVAKWLHGDDKHRQWLRDIATPDVEAALTAAYDRGRAAGRDAEARYREALVHARDLVSHAPEDTWGYVESPDDEGPWPVRDELLYRIDAALSPEARR